MTEKEVKRLKIGDRVAHTDGTEGEVMDVGYAAIQMRWDDNQFSIYQFNEYGPSPETLRAIVPKKERH